MRGDESPEEPLFSCVSVAQRVPQDATVFSKNRERLLNGDIAQRFLAEVVSQARCVSTTLRQPLLTFTEPRAPRPARAARS